MKPLKTIKYNIENLEKAMGTNNDFINYVKRSIEWRLKH